MDEQTKTILAQLTKLDDRQVETLAVVNELIVKVAVIQNQLTAGDKRFAECGTHINRTAALENKVIEMQQRMEPVHRIVYGAVAIALIALAGSILAAVIK